ncbi:MAG: type II toxin-antitoxin system RelE/ParE family toxin [Chloroflexi bacterium]|nr:type II toxin-antitoxin system RelE/ParE family toxin [Chloroflexota bacterium]
MHQLRLMPGAQRQLNKLPPDDFQRIVDALQKLRDNPRHFGTRKLYGATYRIRIGNWRIIYAIIDRDNLVIVGKIARRSEDTYDGIKDLF